MQLRAEPRADDELCELTDDEIRIVEEAGGAD